MLEVVEESVLNLIRTYYVANDSWNHSPIYVPFCYFALATFKNYLIIAGGFDVSGNIANKIFMLEDNPLKEYIYHFAWATSKT